YRKRKVHLLNGAHTLLVSVALQLGYETVREAITQPALSRFVRRAMLDEIAPTLQVDGTEEFAEAVLDRFRNPHIRHALIDITLQATMKMRVRVVPSIQRYVARNDRVPQALAFGFAAFLQFMQGSFHASRMEHGLPVPADDQRAHLRNHWDGVSADSATSLTGLVSSICGDVALWGTDLNEVPGFTDAVSDHLSRIRAQGMSAALDHLS
ncbi:MAG: tagaturonate reductase, partial [bacterium]